MQFCCCAKFLNAKKITLFRLDPHLISSSQTDFRAKREQFSFSFMHKLGNHCEWGTEDLLKQDARHKRYTRCACWKGMHEQCWISIKRVSCLKTFFCSVPLSTHPFRYIRSFQIIRTQPVWLFKHRKRAPETSGKVMSWTFYGCGDVNLYEFQQTVTLSQPLVKI